LAKSIVTMRAFLPQGARGGKPTTGMSNED